MKISSYKCAPTVHIKHPEYKLLLVPKRDLGMSDFVQDKLQGGIDTMKKNVVPHKFGDKKKFVLTGSLKRKTKKYAAVNFLDDDFVEVIPSNWLINESEAMWPIGKPLSYLRRYIKECGIPEKDWIVNKIKLYGYSNNIKTAFEIAKYTQESSDVKLSSESESGEIVNSKRKRKLPEKFKDYSIGKKLLCDVNKTRKRNTSSASCSTASSTDNIAAQQEQAEFDSNDHIPVLSPEIETSSTDNADIKLASSPTENDDPQPMINSIDGIPVLTAEIGHFSSKSRENKGDGENAIFSSPSTESSYAKQAISSIDDIPVLTAEIGSASNENKEAISSLVIDVCANLKKLQDDLKQLNEKQTELNDELNKMKSLLGNCPNIAKTNLPNTEILPVSEADEMDLSKKGVKRKEMGQNKQIDLAKTSKYAIVEFKGSKPTGIEIVCHSWIEDHFVYWPTFCSTKEDFHKLLKQEASPDRLWHIYEINKILYVTDDYSEAKHKLTSIEDSSDINSVAESKHINIKPQKIISNISDAELSGSNSDESNSSPILSINEKKVVRKKRNLKDSPIDQEEIILQLLENNNKLIRSLISRFCSSPSNNHHSFDIPFQSLEEIEENEKFLQDEENMKYMVNYLSINYHGASPSDMTINILKSVLTRKLANLFNWAGQRGKQPFSALLLNTAIVHAVLNTEKTSVSLIEETIKTWLKAQKIHKIRTNQIAADSVKNQNDCT